MMTMMNILDENYDFSAEKNNQLITTRGISFEEVIAAINNGALLEVIEHPNKEKYDNQNIYIVEINHYVYLVPFVRKDKKTIFLKTIFPSRKLSKHYLGEKHERT